MVAVRMGCERFHLPYDNAGNLLAKIGQFFYFKTAREQLLRKFLCGNVYIYVIF